MDERGQFRLDGEDRLILDLSLRCGLSDEEVADLLGSNADEIKRRRNEVTDRLAAEMGAHPPSWGRRLRQSLRGLAARHEDDELDPVLDDAGGLWPHTMRILPWALAAFLFMVILLPFDAAQLPITLPLDAKLDRPFIVLLVVLWVVGMVILPHGERPRLRGGPVHWALALFIATAVLSVIVNGETLVRLGEFDLGLKKIALLCSYALVFLVVASSLRPMEARRFIPYVVVLGCIASVGAVVEYRTEFNAFYSWTDALLPGSVPKPSIATELDATGRIPIIGPTSHPLALAALMALILPFAMVGMLDSEGRRKWLYGLGAGMILAGAIVTQRKTSAFALAVDLAVLTAYRPRQMAKLIPGGLVLVVAISAVAPGAIGSIRDQLKPSALFGVVSTRDRQSDYDAVGPDVLTKPILGRGYQTYDPEKYRVLDNEYLALLIGNGTLGLLAFVLLLISVMAVAHRTIRSGDPVRGPPALAAAAAVVAVAVTSQLFDVIAFPHVPYMFMFMAGMAVACAVPRRQPAPKPAPASGQALVPVRA